MRYVQTNCSLKFYPPSILNNNKWHVEHFDSTKVFSLPTIAVAILVKCIAPQKQDNVLNELCEVTNKNDAVGSVIEQLLKYDLLRSTDNKTQNLEQNSNLKMSTKNQWSQYNWQNAADYHYFTYDYAFLDYSRNGDGWMIADKRMNDYAADQPDNNRIKYYPEHFNRISLPWSIHENNTFVMISKKKQLSLLDWEALSIILSTTFTKTTEANTKWKGEKLLRRTSPSGGSRHPSEGYLFVFNISGLKPGLYHVQTEKTELVVLQEDIKDIKACFSTLFDEKKPQPKAIIIITSIFERNMYRYRDPRTFRTIHMDAGHLVGTIELVASELKIKTKHITQFDDKNIENVIGIDGLNEGVITSVALY